MPIPLANAPIIPNAIIATQIYLVTSIQADATLKTEAVIKLEDATEANGAWVKGTREAVIRIADVEHLPEDLASFQPQVDAVVSSLIMLVAQLNAAKAAL